ncbi:N-6 DNA methylase [Bacillus sp. CGMCC 1.16541]|uniref:N-6 DNA methylase n=1 Tax=Bacillus sp. CGMCC 1.16541 TaxID=2185143 RepID=UPI000D735369|nr:N-6 DNA methylase [Bacillus sp. CGMCC 1.16541]
MSVHEKNMIKLFERMRYRHDLFTVFSDFIEMTAIAISNSVDIWQRNKREKRYLDITKRYTKEEVELFPQLLVELTDALEKKPSDVLGNIFMQLELFSNWKGQFFTPMSVCELMAELIIVDRMKEIEERGYFTINEPAVGGGATIIGMANVLQKRKINYQRVMRVTAQDIDIKSVHMCYIQLSLLGIDAVVMRGDTLAMKFDETWKTPAHIFGWTQNHIRKEDERGEKSVNVI